RFIGCHSRSDVCGGLLLDVETQLVVRVLLPVLARKPTHLYGPRYGPQCGPHSIVIHSAAQYSDPRSSRAGRGCNKRRARRTSERSRQSQTSADRWLALDTGNFPSYASPSTTPEDQSQFPARPVAPPIR